MTTRKERYIPTRVDLTEALRLLRGFAKNDDISKKTKVSCEKLADLRRMSRALSLEDWEDVRDYATHGRKKDRKMVVDVVAETFGITVPENVFEPKQRIEEVKLEGRPITDFIKCPECGAPYVLVEFKNGGKSWCCPNGMNHEKKPPYLNVDQVILAHNAYINALNYEEERINKALRSSVK